jgi:hypothetical protein
VRETLSKNLSAWTCLHGDLIKVRIKPPERILLRPDRIQ